MKPVWIGVAVVLVANAIAIVPAERERAAPVGEFTLQVCRDQVVGGWRDGELPMLYLPLAARMGGLEGVVDEATLQALGFPAEARAVVGDTTREGSAWPMPRMAWLALRQQPDSSRMLEVLRVTPTREALAPVPGELAMRGLIGFEWVFDESPRNADSATAAAVSRRPQRIGVGVVRLLPPQLGLDREQAAMLRPLRDDALGPCLRTVPVTLLMGRHGAVWVSSERRAASGEQR
jgi:hypothetical protein